MANWEEIINISHLHRLYEDGSINVQQLGKGVARRLQNTNCFHVADPELVDIICVFDGLDEFSELKDYEVGLDLLYSFGDKSHRLWIESLMPSGSIEVNEIDHIKSFVERDKDDDTQHGLNVGAKYSSSYLPPRSCVIPITTKPPATTAPITTSIGSGDASSKKYNRTKSTRFMTQNDFNKKLETFGLDSDVIPSEMYQYMKEADDQYQEWLIERFKECRIQEIKAEAEA